MWYQKGVGGLSPSSMIILLALYTLSVRASSCCYLAQGSGAGLQLSGQCGSAHRTWCCLDVAQVVLIFPGSTSCLRPQPTPSGLNMLSVSYLVVHFMKKRHFLHLDLYWFMYYSSMSWLVVGGLTRIRLELTRIDKNGSGVEECKWNSRNRYWVVFTNA